LDLIDVSTLSHTAERASPPHASRRPAAWGVSIGACSDLEVNGTSCSAGRSGDQHNHWGRSIIECVLLTGT